jgi:hypothetical protein
VPQTEYTFRVQMLEIYNENLRDLLIDGRSAGVNKLDILATQASGCNVPGATQVCLGTHVIHVHPLCPAAAPGHCRHSDPHHAGQCYVK